MFFFPLFCRTAVLQKRFSQWLSVGLAPSSAGCASCGLQCLLCLLERLLYFRWRNIFTCSRNIEDCFTGVVLCFFSRLLSDWRYPALIKSLAAMFFFLWSSLERLSRMKWQLQQRLTWNPSSFSFHFFFRDNWALYIKIRVCKNCSVHFNFLCN